MSKIYKSVQECAHPHFIAKCFAVVMTVIAIMLSVWLRMASSEIIEIKQNQLFLLRVERQIGQTVVALNHI